ncbi:unnamed protein product [Cylindrotheca closterium]|uniref:Globin domain-containing protein n=1 Tax=Cylindrotheca closterium TaxID=2856 RepID=A0AAD2G492_9STRA|nr:unnamed protein product [Cylindrotheca closterium]
MELYCESIENAVASWKTVQGLPDYKTLVGELLFREIFKISPGAINMFAFGEGVDCYNLPETLFNLPAFQSHTNGVVTMLETGLEMMLGNNMESLAEALSSLGEKHVTFGIQPPHYIIVESALIRTLEVGLGENFIASLRKDWQAVFRFISRTMMMGSENRVEIVKSKRRSAEQKKVATLRLHSISPGQRSKALTRHSRTDFGRFEGEPKGKHRRRGTSSDPPHKPMRKGTEESLRRARSVSLHLDDDDCPALDDDDCPALDDLTIDITAETRAMTVSDHDESDNAETIWAWGNDTNVEPPKMPLRSPSPKDPPRKVHGSPPRVPLLVRNNSFDSVSTLGSLDFAPHFPKRLRSPTRELRKPLTSAHQVPEQGRKSSFDSRRTLESFDSPPRFPKRSSSPTRVPA